MQKELLPLKKIKPWIAKNKVVDVIIFGSSQRGNIKPKDIDLCIILKEEQEQQSINLIYSLAKITDVFAFKTQINALTTVAFISGNTLARTLLMEGYSIKHDKKFCAQFGFENKSLFVYTLKHFSSVERVKFHYALKGRYGSKGILKQAEGMFMGTGTIILPTNKEEILKEFLDKWDVKYTLYKTLMG